MRINFQFIRANRLAVSTAGALLLAGVFVSMRPAMACGIYGMDAKRVRLAQQAISTDDSVAATAIAELRAAGPNGLEALFTTHAELIRQHNSPSSSKAAADSETWERLSKALDAVGQQRDCASSRLYWHTDMERAEATARATGRPILSLRLLGKLDEELSCANSRFFRTALYANAEISQYLRDHFVLHWQSVRPVPRISIDFGDGRKLERTLTGNSIHYILDAEGRPIDALPGLYGPKAFLDSLHRAEEAARRYAALSLTERDGVLREYHSIRALALRQQWQMDLARAGVATPVGNPPRAAGFASNQPPTAAQAARVAVGKSQIERPLIRAVATGAGNEPQNLETAMTDEAWLKIATLHAEEARLDAAGRELMRRKQPEALAAGRLTISKILVEDPMLRAIRNFERSMAEDTVRNEYLFHAKIHQWFAAALPQTHGTAALNEKVYAELFLTPSSDPWLGLKPDGVYSALERDGIVTAVSK